MRKRVQHFIIRPANRKAKTAIGAYAAFFFIALILATAGLSLWIEDRRGAESAYHLYLAHHPLKPGEKPPKVDWLTSRVWR
jgi:hypothetical protein